MLTPKKLQLIFLKDFTYCELEALAPFRDSSSKMWRLSELKLQWYKIYVHFHEIFFLVLKNTINAYNISAGAQSIFAKKNN